MKLTWMVTLAALLALTACCTLVAVNAADDDDQDQALTIEQLPPAVRATLLAQAQGNPIEDIEKETEDGVTFYSADIIQGDKKLGVEIAEDGKLLKTEVEAIAQGDDDDEDGQAKVEDDDEDDDDESALSDDDDSDDEQNGDKEDDDEGEEDDD